MSDATYRHPSAAGLVRVYPLPLPKNVRAVIAKMKGRPNAQFPENYQQPHPIHCESNCLLLLPALAKDGIQARIAYGVALLPSSWGMPSSERWRVHAWLLVGDDRYDPTYEIAWKRKISEVEYFEDSVLEFAQLSESVRTQIEDGWRANARLMEVRDHLLGLGIDACLYGD